MAVTIFDFSSGVTADTAPYSGPSSNKVTQTIGANTLTLQLDAVSGALAVVMEETAFFGGDLPNLNGNAFETTFDAFANSATLSLDSGKLFDLTSINIADENSGLVTFIFTTSKGSVQVSVDSSSGAVVIPFSDPKLQGVSSVEITQQGAGPNMLIAVDDVKLDNITLPNTAPVFVGAATPVSVSQNAGSTSVAGLLHVSDTDSGQTVTWSASSAPQHGTASFIAATAASGSSDISPGGTLSYTPAAGFAGADSFTVQVSDGSATATRVISVNVAPSTPGAPDLASGSDSGYSADNITNAATLSFSGTSATGDTNSSVRVFIDTNNNGVYDAGTDVSSTATLNNGAWTVNGLSTSGLSDGSYNAYAQVTSATGSLTSSVSSALSVMIDKTAPGQTLSSLALSADTGTSSSDWITKTAAQTVLATLSSPLAADDVLYGSLDGGATWTDISSKVSGTTLSWTGVTFAEGSHSLKFKVTDTAGNDGATATQSYSLDTTAPVVTSVAVPADATYHIGDVLDFTINLTEAVTVDTTGGTPQVALTLNTGGTVYANYVSGSGGSALTFRYSVAPGNVDSDGISLGALSANGATIRDLAGNDMVLTLSSVGSTSGVLVNAAAPVFASASVNGNLLVIDYTDTLGLDATHTPVAGSYVVEVDSVTRTITGVSVDSATKQVTLSLDGTVKAGQIVTVAYNDPTPGDDLNALQNILGNDAASFGPTGVTNNSVALVVSSVGVPTNATYIAGQALDFTVNLSDTVNVDTTGGTPYITLTLDTGGTVQAMFLSGSGSTALTFRYVVAAGDADANGVTLGSAVTLNGATIRDSAGDDLLLTLNAVGTTSGVVINAVAPVFHAASVNGTSLMIEYSDSLALDAQHAPALNDYSVMVAGTANAVTALSIDGSTHKVTLTLASPVLAGQSVTLAYNDPTAGDDLNALQNTLGNDAASFTAKAVSNTTAPVSSGGSSGVVITAPATGGTLNGTVYNDTLTGLGGKDAFYPNGGSDRIDGGDDIDTVVLNGARDQYSLTHNSDGSFTLQNLLDPSVNVAMKNVERLQFNDQLLAINVTSGSAQLAELYHLALGRNPDDAGWQYHVGVSVSGTSTSQIVNSFVASSEFTAGYATLSDTAFLNQLYGNAFNRAPDAEGLAYWQAQLVKVPSVEGRAQIIEGFLASSELAIQITGQIDNGVALLMHS